jgi:hypothetical protein
MIRPCREQDVVRQCLDWLRLVKVPAWRANSGAVTATYKGKTRLVRFNGAPGCSDVLGLLPPLGTFLAVEVKAPGRKPTPLQEGFLAGVRAAGGVAVCVYDLRELQAVLRERGFLP